MVVWLITTVGLGRWRRYLFTMQALAALGRHQEAIDLADEFLNDGKRLLDVDTHKVLGVKTDIMADFGQKRQAHKMLWDWLRDHPDLPSAQIASTLLDWDFATADPETLIGLANRGIRDLAEEQACSNIASLFYRRALVRDRQIHQALLEGVPDGFDLCRALTLALNDYQEAHKLPGAHIIPGNSRARQLILARIAREHGCDLPSEIATPQDTPTETAVRSILTETFGQLTTPGMAPQEVAENLRQQLEQADDTVVQAVLGNLKRMSDDEDFSPELRAAIGVVLAENPGQTKH